MSVLQERFPTYRDTHADENKLQHDFAALHGLCMLKVSTIYVLVINVTRHNIRNVLRMTLLSLRSTVITISRRSAVNRILCLLSTVSYHQTPCARKRVNLGKNINYSSVICFKAAVIDICL